MIVSFDYTHGYIDGELYHALPALVTDGHYPIYIPLSPTDDEPEPSAKIIEELKDNEQRFRQFLDTMNISYTVEIDWP